MGKPIIYIDGKEGTTGLQIYDRLAARDDLHLLLIEEDRRKDPGQRSKLMNAADIVFLCLPDAAAREAVTLVTNPETRIIDTSSAHRTAEGWTYGFPELSTRHRSAIAKSKRVSNPGCHATGFISIVHPLVAMGLLSPDTPLSCFSLTGYSGGGKKMIARYEQDGRPQELSAPALYGLLQNHKHLPEMQLQSGLSTAPVFVPIVDDYYKGMATTVAFHKGQLTGAPDLHTVWERLYSYYDCRSGRQAAQIVRVEEDPAGIGGGFQIHANQRQGTDTLSLIVTGNNERFAITALFDNLGKGASGAAVQNMNIMLGLPEETGLCL